MLLLLKNVSHISFRHTILVRLTLIPANIGEQPVVGGTNGALPSVIRDAI